MTSPSDQQVPHWLVARWLIDVTRSNPSLLGSFLPGNDPVRPTESLYRVAAAGIAQEGKELRAIGGSGRSPEEDERIRRALETRPVLPPVLHQDFEDGTWSSLNGLHMPATAAVIQREFKRTGTRALQVGLKSGDKKLRAQLRDPYNAPFGKETWYGFSIRLPASFDPDKPVVLAQWCDQAEAGDPSGKPPMSIRYQNGQIKIKGAGGSEASDDPANQPELGKIKKVPKDEWLDFKFKVIWQQSGSAEVTCFLNGKEIFKKEEKLGYPGRIKGPYFMFGLKTESLAPGKDLTAYFDNYSHGQSDKDVDPGVLHAEKTSPQRASVEQMDRIARR